MFRKLVGLISAAAAMALFSGVNVTPLRSAAAASGCPERRAGTVYAAGGEPVTANASAYTCLVSTGFATAESRLAVGNDGTLFFNTADDVSGTQSNYSAAGLGVSRD